MKFKKSQKKETKKNVNVDEIVSFNKNDGNNIEKKY